MQWHPTLSTLLMVACEDDMSPVIQLWDLRSAAAMTPARELLGHNKVDCAAAYTCMSEHTCVSNVTLIIPVSAHCNRFQHAMWQSSGWCS